MTINTQKLRAYRQSLKRGVSNTGHGHVYMRPDGLLAKCGGPELCAECAKDLALLMSTEGYEPPTTDDLIDTIDAQTAEIARLREALASQKGAAIKCMRETLDEETREAMQAAGIISQAYGYGVGCAAILEADMDEAVRAALSGEQP